MSKLKMKPEDYIPLYGELADAMLVRHVRYVYNDTAYEKQENGDVTVKEKYEDLYCECVDEVEEILSQHIERDDGETNKKQNEKQEDDQVYWCWLWHKNH